MNLIDAIKSGKDFKRMDWMGWYSSDRDKHNFNNDDILATDWIVKEENIAERMRQCLSIFVSFDPNSAPYKLAEIETKEILAEAKKALESESE